MNPYQPIMAPLVDVIEETPTIKTFVLEPPEPMPFRSGQFVQLTYPGIGEAPFTPSSSPSKPEKLAITILQTGEVTDALHKLEPKGQMLGLRGPFGQGYPVEKLEGKEILVIGGGVGLAPLRALIYVLLENLDKVKRVIIKYGAREPAELLFKNQYKEWTQNDKVEMELTVDKADNNWQGNVGVVTTILKDLDMDRNNSLVFSCGPEIMLKFVTFSCLDLGFAPEQIYLSMNRKMSCGLGKCGRCNIGPYYLCKDGPDMNYAKIKDYPNVF